MTMPVYIGLVHHPIYNKNDEIITTAVTNFDIHDIARTARTYNVARYFIIHPLASQQELVKRVLGYWKEGFGKEYNAHRSEAFSIIALQETIEQAKATILTETGQEPIIVTTDARKYPNTVTYSKLRQERETGTRPLLLLFGTGWGMERELMASFDYIVEPIYGAGEYNHLCVRSAVAIILDRLLGEPWWTRENVRL